jgi:hypothetical protein
LDAAGVSVALATLIFSRIRGSFEVFHLHSDVIDFSSAIEQEPIKRRHLIADMLAASDGSEADLAHITFSRPRIVLPHGAVGPEFQIASWRDGSLTELKIRGTYAACAQLNRIIEQLPQYPWLKWHLREALTLARQNTWKPPMPGELMKLFANKSARLVQSGSQLLDVIIESLQRLQIKLHDFLPATADLWNNSEGIFRPKSENELSDYVARHLKDDLSSRGIVANREVEIRRKQGDGAPGQRTDIYVNATTDGSTSRFDIITAVIETKGCWNPDLSHAMKTQLVDRYLAESQCAYGLYLIGWFNCNQWDREDSRRNAAPWVEASEMQEKYAAQAVTLSQHGRLIKAFVLDVALR